VPEVAPARSGARRLSHHAASGSSSLDVLVEQDSASTAGCGKAGLGLEEVSMERRHTAVIALFSCALWASACSGQPPSGPSGLASGTGAFGEGAGTASRTTVLLHPFPSGPDLPGTSSQLVRNDTGVSMTIHTNGLTAGSAYTVWFVIFNTPEDCVGGCGVDDVLANVGTPSLRLATGNVVGASGLGEFGGHLAVGNTGGPACANDPAILGFCGPGLLDAREAEIHVVVRSHGPVIPDLMPDQIASFLGACSVNGCANVQAAEHQPVQ
jgi:hypothetical protein